MRAFSSTAHVRLKLKLQAVTMTSMSKILFTVLLVFGLGGFLAGRVIGAEPTLPATSGLSASSHPTVRRLNRTPPTDLSSRAVRRAPTMTGSTRSTLGRATSATGPLGVRVPTVTGGDEATVSEA